MAGATHDDDLLDGGVACDSFITVAFEGHDVATAEAAVGSNEQLGLGVFDAVTDGIGAEAAEDDAVGSADAGAGQHGNGQFGHHGQVDGHPVALRDAEALEHVCELADLTIEVPVGVDLPVAGLALPHDSRLIAACG